MTEKGKMLAGKVYSAVDEELLRELKAVREVIHKYNSLRPSEAEERLSILQYLMKPLSLSAMTALSDRM